MLIFPLLIDLCIPMCSCSSFGKKIYLYSGDLGSIPGWENPLEKEMATHSSILA